MISARTLYGFHPVLARLRRQPETVLSLHVVAKRHDARVRELLAVAEAAGCAVQWGEDGELATLAGSSRHQGVVARVSADQPAQSLAEVLSAPGEPRLLLVLDGVTDPHNLGACLRCADAFGAHAVVVPKDRSVAVNATVAKAASGAADTIPVVAVTNLARALDEMKESGLWILGADAGGESLFTADVTGPLAWVLGAEGPGLRRLTRERCDRIVGIPLVGSVASLNVSVAAGICLYATRQQRSSAAAQQPPQGQ